MTPATNMNEERWPWMAELNKNTEKEFFRTMEENDYPKSVVADVHFEDGSFIEIELFRNNNTEVYYYHKENEDRQCPNITQYIEDNLYSWEELMDAYDDAETLDEWQANGFRDEADYWQYRLGS